MGMGVMTREYEPIPTSVLPLKGRMRNTLRELTWPTSVPDVFPAFLIENLCKSIGWM
jgi:hypothetical protein